MNTGLPEIEKKTVPINQYVESLEQPFQEKFLARKQSYRLNAEATSQLAGFAKDYVLVVFSAVVPRLRYENSSSGADIRSNRSRCQGFRRFEERSSEPH
jgi:hypothetical protein